MSLKDLVGATGFEGIAIWVAIANILLLAAGVAVLLLQQISKRAFLSRQSKRFAAIAMVAQAASLLLLFLGRFVGESLPHIALLALYYLPMTAIALVVWFFIFRSAKSAIASKSPVAP